eukprot:Em0002g889a
MDTQTEQCREGKQVRTGPSYQGTHAYGIQTTRYCTTTSRRCFPRPEFTGRIPRWIGKPDVEDFEEFLKLLNVIMTTAPECYFDSSDCQKPAGLIGFPINALLDWPMATTAGYAVFANALVNQQFKRILNYWALFLKTPDSRYVLVDNNEHSLAWLSKTALSWIVDLINKALGDKEVGPFDRFEKIFKSNPRDQYYAWLCLLGRILRPWVPAIQMMIASSSMPANRHPTV